MSDFDPFGVLLLGGIRHQESYAPYFAAHPRLRLIALADEPGLPEWLRNRNRRLSEALQLPYHEDVEAALVDPTVDIVCVATEPTRHARLGLAAIAAGKPAIIDKPLATTSQAARAIADAARAADLPVTYIHRLFSPAIERARTLVDNGTLGLPRILHFHWTAAGALDPKGETAHLITDPELSGGGELINFLGYPIDSLQWITGLEIESVFASTSHRFSQTHRAAGVEDFGVLSLNLEHGVVATIVTGRTATRNHPTGGLSQIRITGSYGSTMIEEDRPRLDVLSNHSAVAARVGRGGPMDALMGGLIDDFLLAIDQHRSPRRTADDGVRIARVIEAALESARTGAIVPIAPTPIRVML